MPTRLHTPVAKKRTRVSVAQKRVRVSVNILDSERKQITRVARSKRMSISMFMRVMAMDAVTHIAAEREEAKVRRKEVLSAERKSTDVPVSAVTPESNVA